MDSGADKKRGAQPETTARRARLTYQPPELRHLGSLAEVTLGSSTSSNDAGHSSGKKAH
jgi:hypothetical protein